MGDTANENDKHNLQLENDMRKEKTTLHLAATRGKHVARFREVAENSNNSTMILTTDIVSTQVDNIQRKKRTGNKRSLPIMKKGHKGDIVGSSYRNIRDSTITMNSKNKETKRWKQQHLKQKKLYNIDRNNSIPIRNSFRTKFNRKFTTPLWRKRKSEYDPDEEARLEKLVFGDTSSIINNLPDEEFVDITNESLTNISKNKKESDEECNNQEQSSDGSSIKHKKKAAWIDEDDLQYTVEAALEEQYRKLPEKQPEKFYTELLENKYKQLVGTPKWAQLDRVQEDFDDSEYEILKHSCHTVKPQLNNLPRSTIEIKALKAINKQTHNEGPIVTSLEFHPTSTVALVAGSSGILSLFQVDGIDNNKLHSIQYKKFPISKATFLKEGTIVLLGSKFNAYCHSYDLISGQTYRIPLPYGITNMKRYEVSPDGQIIAVCGRMGEIYLLASLTKELIGTLKMNSKCRAIAFTPDSKTIITHGDGNEMYVWDIKDRTCMHRAIDDGCLSCLTLAMSPNGRFLATGSKEGVVNLYDTNTVLQQYVPQPLKIAMNLVTSITSLKFNPTSEILAFASDRKANAFKMMHIPYFDVFANFPTSQTIISMPFSINFSPGSGYLGISNKSNSALLYRLKHYGNY